MNFNNGVYAQLTFKDKISVSFYLEDSESVYGHIVGDFGHEIAAEAQSWTELASVGERYEEDGFEIEMMED